VHVAALELTDYRSYPAVAVTLPPGIVTFTGSNGQGKTNLVEALGYLATLGSHRVATDAPLVRDGAERAVVRAAVERDDRRLLLEVEINPGRSNRARVNQAPVPRPREIVGILRMVTFAPEDLSLVRGDPEGRRRMLDELLVQRTPRLAGVIADYDRVLKQRNALLRSAAGRGGRRGGRGEGGGIDLSVLDAWDAHLVTTGSEVVAARVDLLNELEPHVGKAYDALVAADATVAATYRSSVVAALGRAGGSGEGDDDAEPAVSPVPTWSRELWSQRFAEALAAVRTDEIDRGMTLVGPHRDDVVLLLGGLPVKGYASHGESWSMALALRLAAFELLRSDGDDPVLVLDDVFAELDEQRRSRLATMVGDAEQVLVTAAVVSDVPAALAGARFTVASGEVSRAD
jgi:DNA replication and repair protein RecF